MGNPRNLRRASSDEDGDVFDDKSEVTSGSDGGEVPREEEAAGSSTIFSKGPLPPSSSDSTGGASSENRVFQVSFRGAGHGVSAEAASGDNEEQGELAEEAPGTRSRPIRGGRRASKSTWQLMQEDPSFVPRETRYFLHDDRRDGDDEETEDEVEAESKPDTSVPRSTQTRVGASKKLWTPDENRDVWKHDMWERLQKEEAESRTVTRNSNRGRPARRRNNYGYGRANREERWLGRGFRGGRSGQEAYDDESWRDGRKFRGRGRGAYGWEGERRKQYVPRQTFAQPKSLPDTK